MTVSSLMLGVLLIHDSIIEVIAVHLNGLRWVNWWSYVLEHLFLCLLSLLFHSFFLAVVFSQWLLTGHFFGFWLLNLWFRSIQLRRLSLVYI